MRNINWKVWDSCVIQISSTLLRGRTDCDPRTWKEGMGESIKANVSIVTHGHGTRVVKDSIILLQLGMATGGRLDQDWYYATKGDR
jgi:hypothetical protein